MTKRLKKVLVHYLLYVIHDRLSRELYFYFQHAQNAGALSKTKMMVFGGVGILLVVGAIAGYMVIQKKKEAGGNRSGRDGRASQGRPSVASSVGSMMDE
jgi:hypothetical protein